VLIEREYRIECIKKAVSRLTGKHIVIYGTGINARLIVDNVNGLSIIGLMDRNQTGRVIYGHKVLSEDEVIELKADALIIAAQIDSAIAVYSTIKDFCEKNSLEVYDLYGNNVKALLDSIIRCESTEVLLNDRVKGSISSSDVVSIDLKALFYLGLDEEDLLCQIWKSRFQHGTESFVELRQRVGEQQEKSYGDINSIYGVLKSYLCLTEDDKITLLNTELKLRRDNTKCIDDVLQLAKYSIEASKKLFLINESILSGRFWSDVLNDNGITPASYILLNRSEFGHNKYSGLYREIFQYEPDRKYLHIGNDYNADGIAASVYGFQSIVVGKTTDESNTNVAILHDDESNFSWNFNDYITDSIQYKVKVSEFKNYSKLEVQDKYYVFINLEAIIMPGWLEQLVSTANKHPNVKIVCSRVSRSDKTIVYAGKIVSDSIQLQCNSSNSDFIPEYDYVHEITQLSTFSFLVKKTDWDKVQMHACQYTSIECTLRLYTSLFESPIAMYQPLSEILIRDKNLKDFHIVNIEAISRLRMLVTDNQIPKYDRDAGARTAWTYILKFRDMGFDVTFMPMNFLEVQPYVMLLQQEGLRVLYGDYFRTHWKEFIQREGSKFRYIYMQNPDSTDFFIDDFRKYCCNAVIFYYTVDLHFLRLQREYELTGNPNDLAESQKLRDIETGIIEKADVIHVPGDYEEKYLRELYPKKPIRNIPIYIYNAPHLCSRDFVSREGLLFVGSFGHPPNRDAAAWFAQDIFPKVLEVFPEIVWHVVGSNPPIEVQRLPRSNVVLHGYVSDNELTEIYDHSRMVIVPLRYGAGVKGKIVESSYYQVPIVTTPIGAEGISQNEKNMVVCKDAEEFTSEVCSLYTDFERLKVMAEGGRRLIEKYYSDKTVTDLLMMDMNI